MELEDELGTARSLSQLWYSGILLLTQADLRSGLQAEQGPCDSVLFLVMIPLLHCF